MAAATSFVSGGIFGDTTKALRQSWIQRVVEIDKDIIVDEFNIRQVFHDLKLFPSKSQVFEMVHCAREGSKEENGRESDFLTFGEFCIFATELRKYYDQHNIVVVPKALSYKTTASSRGSPMVTENSGITIGAAGPVADCKLSNSSCDKVVLNNSKKNGAGLSCSYDVFLGGSCNPTVWRKDLAIPHFKSHGITFYNPYNPTVTWKPEMMELEHQAKQTSQLLFFVLNEQTRNVVSMIEISYLAGKKRKLICCLGQYPKPPLSNHTINSEAISMTEWQDLTGGMIVVNDLVERQGIPVFDSIDVALECATKVIKQGLAVEDLGLLDGARPVQHAQLQIGDKLVRLREAFDAVDTLQSGTITLNDLKMAFRIHVHRDLTSSDLKNIASYLKDGSDGAIDFNKFCCIVADFRQKKQKHSVNADDNAVSSPMAPAAAAAGGNGNGHEKPEKRSKRKRMKNFFSKVFHRSAVSCGAQTVGESSSSSTMTNSFEQAKSKPEIGSGTDTIPAGEAPGLPLLRDIGTAGGGPGGVGLQSRRGSSVRDVYLGGSANGSWRQDVAVPLLKKHGLTYFNPQCVARRLMPMWAAAIDNSRVVLFVILGNSRSLAAMNEAAFYIGQPTGHTSVVLVVQSISAGATVTGDAYSNLDQGEVLSELALKDYNRGRSYLSDIANRVGVPVFDNVAEAVQCVVDKCKITAGNIMQK